MAQHICGASFCDAQIQLQALDFTLREANHRIPNSLQAVMAAAAVGGGRSGGIRALERNELMARISAIAAIHRTLSASDSGDTIVIGDYLAKVAEGIGVLWSGVGAGAAGSAVHYGGEMVAADVAVRLGMIVNELVTNSFKYAYENGARGEIRIAFSIMDGAFVLIVADDGRGIDDASGRRRGMGSRLIDEISAQLDASFSYQPPMLQQGSRRRPVLNDRREDGKRIRADWCASASTACLSGRGASPGRSTPTGARAFCSGRADGHPATQRPGRAAVASRSARRRRPKPKERQNRTTDPSFAGNPVPDRALIFSTWSKDEWD